jgi:small GTP-binding protein
MSSRMNSGHYTVKMCIMGDGGVGKTTLIERLSSGRFNPTTKMTIGIDFSLIQHMVVTESNEHVPLDITCWDLGGQDRFRFMLSSYMGGADGGLVLYDVNRFESTLNLPAWVNMFRDNAKPDAPLYLIGSKSDLVNEKMMFMVENNLKLLKQDLGINVHFLLSSKNDQTINQVMDVLALEMLQFKTQRINSTSTVAFGRAF